MNNRSHIVAATIVEREGRFLMVEERINGQRVLNQPAGHWDEGESLADAAIRETLEESAWDVELGGLLGIYEHHPDDLDYGFLRFAFIGRALRHHAGRDLDQGIERAVWMSREEIVAQAARHRSPMVLRCVDDYLKGQHYPLDLITRMSAAGP